MEEVDIAGWEQIIDVNLKLTDVLALLTWPYSVTSQTADQVVGNSF
jgi:hypothetical protein